MGLKGERTPFACSLKILAGMQARLSEDDDLAGILAEIEDALNHTNPGLAKELVKELMSRLGEEV